MTALWIALGAYVVWFLAGVGAYPDGPEDGFWWEWFVGGTFFAAVGILGWWVA